MRKLRRNGVEGTFNKDMTKDMINDEMTFLDTENRQALEPNVLSHVVREKKCACCAYGVFSVHGHVDDVQKEMARQ